MTWVTIALQGGIIAGLLFAGYLLIEKSRRNHTKSMLPYEQLAEGDHQLQMEPGNLYYNYRENANELLDALATGHSYAEALNSTRKDLGKIQLVAGPTTVGYAEQMYEACTKLIGGEDQQSCINEFECAANFYLNAIRKDFLLETELQKLADSY
jgi:hypothetical protein